MPYSEPADACLGYICGQLWAILMNRQSDLFHGLLKTKLNQPGITRNFIDRPRLVSLLNTGLRRPLTIVIAPAGFGKTTLVSSWLESLRDGITPPVPAAWLSLDENDNDLVVFLRYFVAAIDSIYPESCPETLALLRSPQSVPLISLVSRPQQRHRATTGALRPCVG